MNLGEKLDKILDLKHHISSTILVFEKTDAIKKAKEKADETINFFVQTVKAIRLANLLINQKYDEELHDTYFQYFGLNYLSKEDLRYLPPLIVIADSFELMHHSNDFLGLLSDKKFIKILSINYLEDLYQVDHREDLFYLDIASLAIFRRNSSVFQCGLDRPAQLFDNIQKGLEFPGSVVWNILSIKSRNKENSH